MKSGGLNTDFQYPVELRLRRPVSSYLVLAVFVCIITGFALSRTLSIGYVMIIVGLIELLFAWRLFGGHYVLITREHIEIRQLFSGKFKTSDIQKVVYISNGYTIHLKGGKEYRIELDNMDAASQKHGKEYFEPLVTNYIV